MRDLTRLVRTATSQHGLLSTAQIRAAGVSEPAQTRLVVSGVLAPVRRGVLRIAGSTASWEQELMAVTMAPGPQRVASHRSALRLWGLRSRDDVLEVSVRRPATGALRGAVVHRSVDLDPDDITECDGIAVTTVARTLCDAGLIFPATEVQRLVDHAVATKMVAAAELRWLRRRVGEHGRNGVVKLESAIDGLPGNAHFTDSGPEIALLRVIEAAGLPAPVLQHPVPVSGGRRFIDVAYPSLRLALEYDGVDEHTRIDRFVDDRVRQNDLTLRGWTVLRYTHVQLRDRPWEVVAQIRRLIAQRSALEMPSAGMGQVDTNGGG
ncbi:MAG: type IV toxin-antitoxin system AbiEi family antitoxin domain-containing protein [Acidimicrobiales bacterium]